jgi:hypothetical protein
MTIYNKFVINYYNLSFGENGFISSGWSHFDLYLIEKKKIHLILLFCANFKLKKFRSQTNSIL